MALSSMSFYLLSVISMGLSPITAKQLFFLNTTFIFIFQNEKLFPLNFSILYFTAILSINTTHKLVYHSE